MTGFIKKSAYLIIVLVVQVFFQACEKKAPPLQEPEYLIKVNQSIIIMKDFERVLEISKSAYPYETFNNTLEDSYKTAQMKNIKLNIFQQLTERAIILERARELALEVTDQELKRAVAGIKAGYPEDTFEQSLLESSVSYATWEYELKIRLLMEKLVDKEIAAQIKVTPDEITAYYESQEKVGSDDEPDENDINLIKRRKIEEAYKPWIESLKKRYTVTINEKLWQKLLDS